MEGWNLSAGVMVLSGLLTMTLVQAAIWPRRTLQNMFGASLEGPVAEIVVRNWGILVTLIGLALVYGGWTSSHQTPILLAAGASKVAFIGLVLAYGRSMLRGSLGIAIAADAVFVLLFAYLLAT